MKEQKFGPLNGHSIGIIMKELVRRAIVIIRSQRQVFDVQVKKGYSGAMDDVLTSADQAAQQVYVKSLRECFPGWGIIGEENSLMIPCSDGSDHYFTVDPLDGTKAFVRRQSHGVGTMISLSQGNKFLAAYVGDVNTQEIYGFRPGSNKVHRVSEFSVSETLELEHRLLGKQCILLRRPERRYSPISQRVISTVFKDQIVDGGSVGTWLARLWKGEVGGALLLPSSETPWDANPVNAISAKLGFKFLQLSANEKKWKIVSPCPIKKMVNQDGEVLLVHESNLSEVLNF